MLALVLEEGRKIGRSVLRAWQKAAGCAVGFGVVGCGAGCDVGCAVGCLDKSVWLPGVSLVCVWVVLSLAWAVAEATPIAIVAIAATNRSSDRTSPR